MLAIAGGKGGTGKTTTALGLATALGATRERATAASSGAAGGVLVVDADVDVPDLHAMAGVEREPTVLDDPDGVPVPGRPGVRVAPAPPATATSAFRDRLRALAAPDDRAVRNRRHGGRTHRNRVLVDAPCGAGPDAALPMAVADATLLVTRPTVAAVRDTAKTAAMARALDTSVAAVAVVQPTAERPSADPNASADRSLSDVFDVEDVVRVPAVDGDPLADDAHAASMRRLSDALSVGETPF